MLKTSVKLDFLCSMMMEQETGRQRFEQSQEGKEEGSCHAG
jgi:hypothetical protein